MKFKGLIIFSVIVFFALAFGTASAESVFAVDAKSVDSESTVDIHDGPPEKEDDSDVRHRSDEDEYREEEEEEKDENLFDRRDEEKPPYDDDEPPYYEYPIEEGNENY